MSDIITLTGIVATTPKHLVTKSGLVITSFRLASGQRKFDRTQNAWVDVDTNWYSISTFRHLAHNVENSLHKGEHVIVSGRIRIRQWENGDRTGTTVDIEAQSVGHDLTWCTTRFQRNAPGPSAPAVPHDEPAPERDELSPNGTVGWATPFPGGDLDNDSDYDADGGAENDFDNDPHDGSGDEPADEAGDGFLPPETSGVIAAVS